MTASPKVRSWLVVLWIEVDVKVYGKLRTFIYNSDGRILGHARVLLHGLAVIGE